MYVSVERERERESRRGLSCPHRDRGTNLRWNLFSLGRLKCFRLFNIPDARTNSRGHISFSLPPTHCAWTHLLLAWYSHNLRGISDENICVLFTLGTWCISSYFIPSVQLLQLHRQMSKRIFKSISNTYKSCYAVKHDQKPKEPTLTLIIQFNINHLSAHS